MTLAGGERRWEDDTGGEGSAQQEQLPSGDFAEAGAAARRG